jgi:hypothetical protein
MNFEIYDKRYKAEKEKMFKMRIVEDTDGTFYFFAEFFTEEQILSIRAEFGDIEEVEWDEHFAAMYNCSENKIYYCFEWENQYKGKPSKKKYKVDDVDKFDLDLVDEEVVEIEFVNEDGVERTRKREREHILEERNTVLWHVNSNVEVDLSVLVENYPDVNFNNISFEDSQNYNQLTTDLQESLKVI